MFLYEEKNVEFILGFFFQKCMLNYNAQTLWLDKYEVGYTI